MLSDQFVEAESPKVLSDKDDRSDSSSDEDAKRPFNARDAALFAELAAQASLTQVENDWLIPDLVNQQVLASTPVIYTEELHDALNGGGVRSMSDSEHDMVWVTFTNESFTHWAVSCSLQYRSSESLILNKEDSVLWFDDLEDGGELKRLNQTSFFKKLSGKWKFYSAEVLWHHRLTQNWKNIIQDGFPPGEAYDRSTEQQKEYEGAEQLAGLKCSWKALQFRSENCGDQRWWDGVLQVETCALSCVVIKTVVMYYTGHTAPLQPFIDAGLCPAPPTGGGKLQDLNYLPKWDCTEFRDNFAAYCLYFRLNGLFVSSTNCFQWKKPVVQGMFSDAPTLWPLAKASEKKTWMQTNSRRLFEERHLAIDTVEKAMLLPANCRMLWEQQTSELQTFVSQALLAAPLPSNTIERDQEQSTEQERSSRLKKPDTKTAAVLQREMHRIFALAMVGQAHDLTKMCEQDPETWSLEFTDKSVAAAEKKGFGVNQSSADVGQNIAYTSVHTDRSSAVILANYTGRYRLSNEDRTASGEDKRSKCGDMLHFSHMMYRDGLNKSLVTPMQIESRTLENYDNHFDTLLVEDKDFGLQPTTFAAGIFQPSVSATLGARDQDTRNSPAFVLKYTVMQAKDFLDFWNSHCRSNLQKVPSVFDDVSRSDGTIRAFSFVPCDFFVNWYMVDPRDHGCLMPSKRDRVNNRPVHPFQEQYQISSHCAEFMDALAQGNFSKWGCFKTVRDHCCLLPVSCI